MGKSSGRLRKAFAKSRICIFCGGSAVATTEEHCPPRGLFRDRLWPQGFVFPACKPCNSQSADDDRIVALIAHLDMDGGNKDLAQGKQLLVGVQRNVRGLIERMFDIRDAGLEAFKNAYLRDQPQNTICNVTDEMDAAVQALASKLTKAIYFKHTGQIFPSDGRIQFRWFTNADVLRQGGRLVEFEALKHIASSGEPIRRGNTDLRDQFDYRYSVGDDQPLHLLQVVFGTSFGFVTFASPVQGVLEGIEAQLVVADHLAGAQSPFRWIP